MSSILDNFYKNLDKPKKDVECLAIGISRDGILISEELDEKPYNHAVAFNYIAMKFNLGMVDTMYPIVAGENLASQGVLALQIRKDICIGYFPKSLELIQYKELESELSQYQDLNYQFKECSLIEGFVSREVFLEHAKSITLGYHNDNIRLLSKNYHNIC